MLLTVATVGVTWPAKNRAIVMEFQTNAPGNGQIAVQCTTGSVGVPQLNGLEIIPLATLDDSEYYFPRFMKVVRP